MEEIDDEYLLQKYPDSPSCIVSVKELDELAIIVQENVDNGWPKEHIMYLNFKWGLQYSLSYEPSTIPEAPPQLKSFCESIYFHANQKTLNLIRGSGDSGAKKEKRAAKFDWENYNIII